MKRTLIIGMSGLLLLSSCSYTAEGAYVGGQFGHVIGSAIGGIAGGGRGHDVGSLIGTVGGAVAGAAIGSAVEKSHERQYAKRMNSNIQHQQRQYDIQGERDYAYEAPLEIRHATITESIRDGVLTAGEECTVRFEIFNTSNQTVYDVVPLVEDITGNKHIKISPNLRIEGIGPRQGIRYTATILADRKLKDGEIEVLVGVVQSQREIKSQTRCFTVPTAKRR